MASNEEERTHAIGEAPQLASGVSSDEPSSVVFRSFSEACKWSRENSGRAFTRSGDGFRPVQQSEAYQATQSWHDFEELYVDGPYRNEMG